MSEEELRNKHCVDFSPPEDAQKDWALFQQLNAGAIDHYQLEKHYFRRDGSLVWGRLSISLLNSRPSPVVVGMVEDITEKKRAQDDLELVATEMGAAVTRGTRDLRYLWANRRYADWRQRPLDEIVGRPILDVLGTNAFDSLKFISSECSPGKTSALRKKSVFRGLARDRFRRRIPNICGSSRERVGSSRH